MRTENHRGTKLYPIQTPAEILRDMELTLKNTGNKPRKIQVLQTGWMWQDETGQWWDNDGAVSKHFRPHAEEHEILFLCAGTDAKGRPDIARLAEIPPLSLEEEKDIPLEAWIKTIIGLTGRNHILTSQLRRHIETLPETKVETTCLRILEALNRRGIILKESRRVYFPWINPDMRENPIIDIRLRNGKKFRLKELGAYQSGEYPQGGILIQAWSPELKDPGSDKTFGRWTYLDNSPNWPTAYNFLKAASRTGKNPEKTPANA